MAVLQAIDKATYDAIRDAVLADPFVFAKVVCGHTDLSLETHRPLMYLAAGCGDKLIELLDDTSFQSFTIRHMRKRFLTAGADWRTEAGRQRFFELLDFVNIRVFRGSAKSSSITHAITLWKATVDPNLSQVIVSNSEKNAVRFSKQIRNTILSDTYQALFPERVPENPAIDLTESALRLGGRTRPDREASIMAFGYKSGIVGWHFDEFNFDDLVGDENSSATELEGVYDFLSNMTGLYNPGKRYPVRRRHVGTRYDESDDDAYLRRIKGCFSIDIPIEYYPNGRPENILVRGIPTAPEWKSEKDIARLLAETLGDDQKGAWFWRANFWMDPTAGGGRLFPTELVESCKWMPHETELPSGKTVAYVARPKQDRQTREWLYANDGQPIYGYTRIDELTKFLGVDQAFSWDEAADEWAVCCVGMDSEGVYYELETAVGHGYEAMLDKILYMDAQYKPKAIGLEKGGMQNATHFWLDRFPQFRKIKSRIVPIGHNNQSKEWRIMNGIAEPMRMGQLWIGPESYELHKEMESYKGPGPKAKDNKLDGLAIALSVAKKPIRSQDVQRQVREWERKKMSRYDKQTGVLT